MSRGAFAFVSLNLVVFVLLVHQCVCDCFTIIMSRGALDLLVVVSTVCIFVCVILVVFKLLVHE